MSGANESPFVPPAAITVNTTNDGTNGGDGLCTLREAITAANNDAASGVTPGECVAGSGNDTITITVSGTINLAGVLPAIATDMTINGPGSSLLTLRRDTGGEYRVLLINSITVVSISGITVTNGKVPVGQGSGGGIASGSILTLTDVVVSGNRTSDGVAGSTSAGSGGGIYNGGSLTMVNCVVSGNSTGIGTTGPGGPGSGGRGGGIDSPAPFTLINSVISGNSTGSGPVPSADGGGIFMGGSSFTTFTTTNSTVTGNSASTGVGHGVFNAAPTTSIGNTIIARNGTGGTGPDLAGSYTSQGHNLIGNATGSSGFVHGSNGDQVGTAAVPINPRLGPLANNGGQSQSHALLPGSPAIDAGDNAKVTNPPFNPPPFTDQRGTGFDRTTDGNGDGIATVDIGAYEVQTILVTNTNDDGPGSLRQAILDANASAGTEAINFQTGLTGTIDLETALSDLSTSMSINGPGPGLLTVRRSTAGGTPNFRIFTINSGNTVSILGLTISNGISDRGAGISSYGNLIVSNSTISGNTASDWGGGIYNDTVGTLSVTQSSISGNVTPNAGGGIANFGALTVVESMIAGNTATGTGLGGGIWSYSDSTLTVTNSTISGNTAANGGGIYSHAAVILANTTISGNTATSSGGGFLTSGVPPTATLTNVTITDNHAGSNGGGAVLLNGNDKLRNTIVAGNFLGSGTSTPNDISGAMDTSANSSNNLIGTGGSAGLINNTNGNKVGVANPGLGLLANNGGPTLTHALLLGSPALDAGSNALSDAANLTTDQRGAGFIRKADSADVNTTQTVDIGAFEARASVENISDKLIAKNTPLSFGFNVGDAASITTVTASSSNTTLVPNLPANINVTGSGSTRTLNITPAANQTGTSTITVTVTSGSESMSDTFVLTVAELPDVTLAVSPASVSEDGATNLVYTFTRTGVTSSALTVNFSVGGTAAFSTDYAQTNAATFGATSGTVSIGVGNSTALVTLNPSSDITVEEDETAILTVTTGSYNVASPSAATGTITNDDTNVTVAVSPASVSEDGATNLVYTFTRTGVTSGALTANFSVGGTGTFNTDYTQSGAATFTASTGTVTFAAGSGTKTITIDPTSDGTVEGNDTAILTVISGTGYNVGSPSAATGTITNDDTAVTVAVSPSSVAEDGASNLIYTFTRTGVTSGALTVNFSVSGTAAFSTDYTQTDAATFGASSGTVTFTAGSGTKTITIDPTSDTTIEASETAILTVSSGTGYNVGSPSAATGTITNDDTGPLTLIVNSTGDAADINIGDGVCDTDAGTAGDQCTLRAAIQEVNFFPTGIDVINFSLPGNSTITIDTALPAISGNLNINGLGADLLTVMRSTAVGSPLFRIFRIESGTVNLSGLKISGGSVDSPNLGGGVSNGGTLTLTNITVNGNAGYAGGGIHSTGTLTVNNSTISGNTSSASGGGMAIEGGTVTLNNSSVSGNNGGAGGGIYNQYGILTLTDSTVSNNTGSAGGGIYNTYDTASLTLTNCTISNNISGSFAGGIFNNNIFTMTNTTVSSNTAEEFGGGIRNNGGTLRSTNSTVSQNKSNTSTGGGISNGIFPAYLGNTIIADNTSALGGPDLNGPFISEDYNLIGNTLGATFTGTITHNIVNQSANLGLLANNGGPTFTHALMAGSPALDAGSNTLSDGVGLTTDQRGAGFIRKADSADANTTQTVDIGAFEARASVEDITDKSTPQDTPLSFDFNVGDAALITSVTASSSNTTLVPNLTANINVTGSGSTLTLNITPAANQFGISTITVTVTSGLESMSDTFVLTVTEEPDVSVAVSPPSVSEDGATNLVYTFTRTGVTTGALTVNFSASGIASSSTDYALSGATTFVANSGTVTFTAGNATKTVTVDPTTDLAFEANETAVLTVTSGSGYSVGSPNQATGTITNDDPVGGIIRFSLATYRTTESSGSTTITVVRDGDNTEAVTVDYATPDDSEATTVVQCSTINGTASPRCDFTTALGTLRFAAGEISKTFTILISQDNFVEGPETLSLTLSNLTGGATFGVPSTAALTIADDASEPGTSPNDDPGNFVRQHYLDFLNREPDAAGLAFWTNQITSCGADAQCIEVRRIHVSASFFLSIEFQDTGYLVERLYKSSYGDDQGTSTIGGTHTLPVPIVKFSEFLPDTQKLAKDVIVGQSGWETVLENNKQAFTTEFVQRTRFANAYPTTLSPAAFVAALFANAGVTPSTTDRDAAIAEFGGAGNTADLAARGRALRRVAENSTLTTNEVNRAFVLMQFFGYLRRNPDAAQDTDHSGYDFWLTKLNQFNGDFIQAEMVKGFLSSIEYRHRFGP
jgi:CSLREA domain-containing protein